MAVSPNPAPRVLVADDDAVSRRLMRAFLDQARYHPVVCENGVEAIAILLGDDAPRIAILDWVMPDISGPEVCTRVRNENLEVQPYLIVLTSKRDKAELAHALDAGADDFLTKPFNAVELAARLKVAERSVGRQMALQTEIRRLRDGRKDDPDCIDLIRKAVEQAAETLGFGRVTSAPSTETSAPATWTAIILPEEGIWLDLLTELIPRTGEQNPEESWQFHQAVVEAIRLENPSIIAPFPPKSTTLRPQDNVNCQAFAASMTTVRVTSARYDAPVQKLAIELLRSRDVLADAYPPASEQHVPLLRRGAALNQRVIERLAEHALTSGEQGPRVPVFRPSTFAQSFG